MTAAKGGLIEMGNIDRLSSIFDVPNVISSMSRVLRNSRVSQIEANDRISNIEKSEIEHSMIIKEEPNEEDEEDHF